MQDVAPSDTGLMLRSVRPPPTAWLVANALHLLLAHASCLPYPAKSAIHGGFASLHVAFAAYR